MTRSPSPTNSAADNPHASLMGSARKRGRSRSMTKSPSPQRLTSEAPCLASVQEEEPEPTIAPTPVQDEQQRLATVETAPFATETKHDEVNNVVISDDVASVPTSLESIPPKTAEPEPSLATPSAMDVGETDSTHETPQTTVNDNIEENETALQTTLSSQETSAEEKDTALPATEQATNDEANAAIDDSSKLKETGDSVSKVDETPSSATETSSNVKSIAGVTKTEKKQSGQQQVQNNAVEFVSEENEPTVPDEAANTVLLSWYDSDLNLTLDDKDLLSAKPLSDGIFGLLWGGVRANRGVTDGKVFYEVLITDELQPATRSPLIPEGENATPEMRIGWSTAVEGKRQLGEMDHSYGYASCGKKVVGGKFEPYGVTYGKNDVVGVYLEIAGSQCRVQFTVNRVRQGDAFEFDKEGLAGQALFPHVYAKNLSFKVNFGTVADGFPLAEKASAGKVASAAADKSIASSDETIPAADKNEATKDSKQEEENAEAKDETTEAVDVKMEETEDVKPASEVSSAETAPFDESFKFLNHFLEENQSSVAAGLKGPAARECCELIMMIGLPGCGKTTWVQNYLKENTESSFTLLSVDSLLDNMKVSGEVRDPSNTPQWQKIVEQLSRNMARLIEIACKRRRHFLIDQTNVFASEQKRRLKGFGGFKTRRAVAVIPNVEEYKRRYELKVAKYGKEVPETTLNTMKANIFVPSLAQNWYTDIVFAEQPEAEAQETIKKLNEEGRKLLPPRRNRASQSNRQKHANNNSNANSNYTSRWSQNRPQGGVGQQYGKNRYGGGGGAGGSAGGYNRYGNKPHEVANQYGHHRGGDYRSGNGYGRRDDMHRGGNYGGGGNRYDSWNRNSSGGGYYNDRGYTNRGYNQQQQDHSNNRYDARRRDRRGYNNNGSGWNVQGGQQSQQWNNSYPKSSSESWYLWWQSNLNNLLAPNGSNADGSASSQWNQYGSNSAHQSSSYGNYHSKGSGAGGSSGGMS
uniref:B30.2/SPRY domain-containing protein n=1 Tax=Anopheles farauti TaxID=69004 RepID=A0A182QUT2_9DIPT